MKWSCRHIKSGLSDSVPFLRDKYLVDWHLAERLRKEIQEDIED